MSALSRRNSCCCTSGIFTASVASAGNEKRQTNTVSSAIASHGYLAGWIAFKPTISPGRWKPSTCSRPSSSSWRVFTTPPRTAKIAAKRSPLRNTWSPARYGPICSTSMCSSRNAVLSTPAGKHTEPNAQVEQKRRSSPSSAIGFGDGLTPACTDSFIHRAPPAAECGLQGLRVACAGGLAAGEVGVEAHGDDTEQEASARGHAQAIVADLDQSIALDLAQPCQFVGEIFVEIKLVARFERRNLEDSVTHQLLDRIGADEVVTIERQPTHDRKAAGIQSGIVGRQVAGVLAEGGADVRDRTHAQADQVAVAVRGVTLEVALQRAGVLRLREIITGAREVVHADIAITSGSEFLDAETKQLQARCRIRQVGRNDLPLRLEALRQVRIGIAGDAVGTERDDLVERAREFLWRLLRQSVDQVDAGRTEGALARGVEH